MCAASKCFTAVVAGAMTAGIGATTVAAVPDADDSAGADVQLAAITVIPIIDFDPTVGPLTVIRRLGLFYDNPSNGFLGGLYSQSGTIYDLPGLYTNFQSASTPSVSVLRNPGESVVFGFDTYAPDTSEWSLLGGVAGGTAEQKPTRSFDFTVFTGGSEGIGAGLGGTLADTTGSRSLTVGDSGFDIATDRTTGDFDGQLSLMPFDGFKAVGDGTAIDTRPNADFRLGSLTGSAGGEGRLSGDVGLCLGSAKGTDSCGGRTAFASFDAPVKGRVQVGETNIVSADIPTNLAVAVKDRRLTVTGDIGGVVSVGNIELGRKIPIDIAIPRNSTDSLRAVPRKLGSDSGTGGRHRAPLRSLVSDVKDAVSSVAHSKPKHAKPDAQD